MMSMFLLAMGYYLLAEGKLKASNNARPFYHIVALTEEMVMSIPRI